MSENVHKEKVMKKQIMLLMVFGASSLYGAAVLAETFYYVQSVSARVRAEPSFTAKVIAGVAKGQKLTSTGKDGAWIKIKVGDKEGFVSSLLLSTQPPLDKTVVIKAEDPEIKQNVRRRASSFSSAAAARGLVDEDKKDDANDKGPDYESVKKMEAIKIPNDEVDKFAPKTK
jgi:uncharacterized protein YgiM (DUF1202 family)